MKLLGKVWNDVLQLPWQVKLASGSAGVFYFAWGFSDIYLNVITHRAFLNNLAMLGIVHAIYHLVALLMTLPAMEMDRTFSIRRTLLLSKVIYVATIISYFLGGLFMSSGILIVGYVLNGIGNPICHNSYESAVRHYSNRRVASRVFGYYGFNTGTGWCLGLLLSALFVVPFIGIEYTLLFTLAFVLPSILGDLKLPRIAINWKKNLMAFLNINATWKRDYRHLKSYDSKTYFTLLIWFFWSFLDYMTFLFTPIFALSLNLGLTGVGLLTLLVRFPYIFSFIFSEFSDHRDRFSILATGFFVVSGLLFALMMTEALIPVILVVMLLSTVLAFIRPTIAGILTTLVSPKRRIEITGLQTLFVKGGSMLGALLFGLLAQESGFHTAYGIIGVLSIAVASACMWMRSHFLFHGALEYFQKTHHGHL